MMTVSVMKSLSAGLVVDQMSGTITAAYPAKSGTSDKGDWKMQSGSFTDDTGEIKITLKNSDVDLIALKGKRVTISSSKTKHGMNGVKLADNEYNGKVTREVHITNSANWNVEGQQGQSAQAPVAYKQNNVHLQQAPQVPQQDTQVSPSMEQLKQQTGLKSGAELLEGEVKVKAIFYKNAKLHAYAIASAMLENEWMVKYSGHGMTPEMFQAAVASIYIQSTRELSNVSPAIGFPAKKEAAASKPQTPESSPAPVVDHENVPVEDEEPIF